MVKKYLPICFAILLSGLSLPAICQEENLEAAADSSARRQLEWAWGEVVSIDYQKGEFNIVYLNEETFEEKTLLMATDAQTVYENAQSLLDIKPMDSVSIDYTITEEGVNLAMKVAVEKAQDEALPQAEELEGK